MALIQPLDHRNLVVAQHILDVLLPAYAQEARLLQVEPVEPLQRSVADIQSSPDFYLGASVQDQLMGVLSLGPDDEAGQLCIHMLVVHPQAQRQGLAHLLMQELLRRSQGMVVAVATAAGNAPALALYRKLGFVVYRQGAMGAENLVLLKLRRPQ